MRRLILLAILALGLAACGGSGTSKDTLKITVGRSGGSMIPYSVTIAPGGGVTTQGNVPGKAKPLTTAKDSELSQLVRNGLPSLKSDQCPGTFPDESAMFITALGKTVTVRGACEPSFTKLWNSLVTSALAVHLTALG